MDKPEKDKRGNNSSEGYNPGWFVPNTIHTGHTHLDRVNFGRRPETVDYTRKGKEPGCVGFAHSPGQIDRLESDLLKERFSN
jgi:hypothetical protein